jgi:hypothetical protein
VSGLPGVREGQREVKLVHFYFLQQEKEFTPPSVGRSGNQELHPLNRLTGEFRVTASCSRLIYFSTSATGSGVLWPIHISAGGAYNDDIMMQRFLSSFCAHLRLVQQARCTRQS